MSKLPNLPPALPAFTTDMLKKHRLQNLIVAGLFIGGVGCFAYLVIKSFRATRLSSVEGELSCVQQKIPLELRDERMAGLIEKR